MFNKYSGIYGYKTTKVIKTQMTEQFHHKDDEGKYGTEKSGGKTRSSS